MAKQLGIMSVTTGVIFAVSLGLLIAPIFDNHRRVYHSMHEFQHGAQSRRYWVFDHVMSTESNTPVFYNTMSKYCLNSLSDDDRKSCSPNVWHYRTACPSQNEEVTAWENRIRSNGVAVDAVMPDNMTVTQLETESIAGQFVTPDANYAGSIVYPGASGASIMEWGSLTGYTIKYSLSIMQDACRLSRIPQTAFVVNNVDTFSLTGGHDANLLLFFTVLCVLVLFMSQVMRNDENKIGLWTKYAMAALFVLLIILFVVDQTTRKVEVTTGGTFLMTLSAKGSWFYGLVYIIITYITIFYNDIVMEFKTSDVFMRGTKISPEEKVAADNTFELNLASFKKTSMKQTTAGGNFEMAPTVSTLDFTQVEGENFTVSLWNALQFVSLPLLLLSVYTYCRNFDSDTDIVVVFVIAFFFCSLDMICERVQQVCAGLIAASVDKTFSKDCKRVSQIVTVLTTVLQVSCVIVLLDTIPWFPYDTHHVLDDTASFDAHFKALRWIALVFFIVYYAVATVIKLMEAGRYSSRLKEVTKPLNFLNKEKLAYIYLFFVGIYAIIASSIIINEYLQFNKVGAAFDGSITVEGDLSSAFQLMKTSKDNDPGLRMRWQSNMYSFAS